MNVVVQCFHCNAILELDEGFRGGVCRCSACGSLLQVPKAQASASTSPRKIRPDVPPAPARRDPAASGAKTEGGPFVRSPIGSGPAAGMDYGGSSSGLGRIHKTRPVADPPSRKKSASDRDGNRHESLSPPPPPPPRPPLHGLPEIRAARQNSLLYWTGIVLILILAAAVVTLVVIFMTHREPLQAPRIRSIPAPALTPATEPQPAAIPEETSPSTTPGS